MRGTTTRVLISTSTFGSEDPEPLQSLQRAGIEVQQNPYGRTLTEEEVAIFVRDADGILAGTEPITARVLESAPRLRVISRVGSGLDNVDLQAASLLGIAVTGTPEAPVEAVAELALGGILTLLRKVHVMDQALRRGTWEKQMGTLLGGKTIGIIGLGRIGKRLVELAAPFRVQILACDIQPDHDWAQEHGVGIASLLDLLRKSDIVTIHITKASASGYFLGRDELSLMKPGAILLNLARGGLVDEGALLEALERRALAGAYLDTFEREPYSGPLAQCRNVLLTPHAGSYAREARVAMELEAVQNLLNILGSKR